MRIRSVAAALSASILIVGCGGSSDTAPARSSGGTAGGPALFRPMFNVTSTAPGFNVPYPTDLYFSGSTDGTLNIPNAGGATNGANAGSSALFAQRLNLNNIDGYGTQTVISARFTQPIAATSLSAATVKLIEVKVDNTKSKATTGVCRPLTYGTDYTASVAATLDSSASQLDITPLKPLRSGSSTTCGTSTLAQTESIGYLVVLTDGIKDTSGNSAAADTDFQVFKDSQPGCGLANATLKGLCGLVGAQLSIANALGTPPANVVAAWSFSTESIGDSLRLLTTPGSPYAVPAQPIGVVATGASISTITGGSVPGPNANVYYGNLRIPYHQPFPATANDPAAISSRWLSAAPSPIDSTGSSFEITRYNPIPKRIDYTNIPLLVTVPNASSPSGGVKPAAGWPVVIFMPGLGSYRADMLAVANGYANAGFVVASIDHPLHGITTLNSYAGIPGMRQPWNATTKTGERSFDLDVLNNTTGAPGPDGKPDDAVGLTFGAMLSNPLGFRDTVRQSSLDIVVLAKSLPNLDLNGDGVADIDPNRIHFAAHSGGAVTGTAAMAQAVNVKSAYLNNPGSTFVRLLFESTSYGPTLQAALKSATSGAAVPGTTLYEEFIRDVQTIADPSDPGNYIAAAVAARPVLLNQAKNDQTIPNSATQRMVLAGGLTKASAAGFVPVAAGAGKWVNFLPPAGHSSLFAPSYCYTYSTTPATCLAITAEEQTQMVSFAVSGGTGFQITNSALLEP